MRLKIALIFNCERADTIGSYFKRALEKTGHTIHHYWTQNAETIPADYDLYLRIERHPASFLDKSPFTQISRIYSSSKIGFNYSIKNDINMRIFEVMSCGSLLITNRIRDKGFKELFEDGKHLVTYRNRRELFKLVDYYLAHDREREEIAGNGYQLVTKYHTYEMRVAKMFDYIKERLVSRYPRLTNL